MQQAERRHRDSFDFKTFHLGSFIFNFSNAIKQHAESMKDVNKHNAEWFYSIYFTILLQRKEFRKFRVLYRMKICIKHNVALLVVFYFVLGER